MTKICLYVNGRPFDVNIEDNFLQFLRKEMDKDFNVDRNIDVKTLLNSYLSKTHKLFQKEQELEKILKKLT
jgi:hypothetical protein